MAEASSSDPARTCGSRSGSSASNFALPVRDPARAYYVDPTWTVWEGLCDESARDYLRTTGWRISMLPERSWIARRRRPESYYGTALRSRADIDSDYPRVVFLVRLPRMVVFVDNPFDDAVAARVIGRRPVKLAIPVACPSMTWHS